MANPPLEGDSTTKAKPGVKGTNTAAGGIGVYGESSQFEGVHGISNGQAAGVAGYNQSGVIGGSGVWGESNAWEGVHGISHGQAAGAAGYNISAQGGPGVWGEASRAGGEGVHGISHTGSAGVGGYSDGEQGGPGVYGNSINGIGVHGSSQNDRGGLFEAASESGSSPALMATTIGQGDAAQFIVFGERGEAAVRAFSFAPATVMEVGNAAGGSAAYFSATGGTSNSYFLATFYNRNDGNGASALYATSEQTTAPDGSDVWAGVFDGKVFIRDDLHTAGYFFCPNKFFRIDHPLDPANKYLVHATVESPDRTNLYNGTAVLGEKGDATVRLPQWFDVLNCDCHYQLTCVGGHAPVYVAQEIRDNEFRIAGGHRGLKVCWQVTGRRHDPAARAHPVVTEPEKPPSEKGLYQDPLAHGQSADKRIGFERQRAQAEKAQEFLNRIRASERGAA